MKKKKTKIYAKEISLKPAISVEKLKKSTYRRGFYLCSLYKRFRVRFKRAWGFEIFAL